MLKTCRLALNLRCGERSPLSIECVESTIKTDFSIRAFLFALY